MTSYLLYSTKVKQEDPVWKFL